MFKNNYFDVNRMTNLWDIWGAQMNQLIKWESILVDPQK